MKEEAVKQYIGNLIFQYVNLG